jgi:hypothetical protein
MSKGKFMIRVTYDSDCVEVEKVDIVGGFPMPSLEMTDLLGDVIHELEDKRSGSWEGYMAKVSEKVNKEKRELKKKYG